MRPGTKIKIQSFFNELKNKFERFKNSFNKKYIIYTGMVVAFIFLIIIIYNIYRSFIYVNPDVPSDYAEYNRNTIFSINKIYMFSSANATNNTTNKALWNLNLHQFTDLGLYINCASTRDEDESTIKKLYITNVKFSDSISGNPNLYYKDIRNFGKLDKIDDNLITDRLNYDVLDPNNDIDYTKPQIKSDGSVPITLSYINYNFKENVIISDTRNSSCV